MLYMYISMDAGGTGSRVGASLELDNPVFVGEPLRRKNTHDFDDDMDFMIGAALQLADGEPITAVGIGIPGKPNEEKTELKSAKNLNAWAGKPLVARLSEGLGVCPVIYDDDVQAICSGEAYYGDTEGDFDYIIWGTGIGGGAVRRKGNKPSVSVLNWRSNFAEWEADCGGSELLKTFGKPPEELTAEEWEIVADKFGAHLERYVANNQPKAVVFGGGLAVAHSQMIETLAEPLPTLVTVTKFGNDSGLMGGFGLIKRSLEA